MESIEDVEVTFALNIVLSLVMEQRGRPVLIAVEEFQPMKPKKKGPEQTSLIVPKYMVEGNWFSSFLLNFKLNLFSISYNTTTTINDWSHWCVIIMTKW